jgi:NAD(P)-dependent dehydrogenase (short-subunit alcohol dehydrogenase family)
MPDRKPRGRKSAAKTSVAKKSTTKKSPAKKSGAKKSSAKKSSGAQSGKAASSHAQHAEAVARRQRQQQKQQEQRRAATKKRQEKREERADATGPRRYPTPPLPEQHLEKPGNESDLDPRPFYDAPHYRGAGKLEGRVALITGGDSGIGRAVAVLFAREGADIAIGYLSEHDDAEETQRAVEAEGRRALLIPGDVSDPEYAEHAIDATITELGKLDILVNNAAYQQHQESIEDITDEQFELTFRTNIFGYFYMTRAAVRHLDEGGVIINTSSVTGVDGSGGLIDYASTKGAINAFTKSMAQSLLPRGIRVNAVAPGPVWTPLNPADLDAEKVARFGADVPMKRPAQPEEIAPSYVFLAADTDSSYITGEIIHIFGGQPTP